MLLNVTLLMSLIVSICPYFLPVQTMRDMCHLCYKLLTNMNKCKNPLRMSILDFEKNIKTLFFRFLPAFHASHLAYQERRYLLVMKRIKLTRTQCENAQFSYRSENSQVCRYVRSSSKSRKRRVYVIFVPSLSSFIYSYSHSYRQNGNDGDNENERKRRLIWMVARFSTVTTGSLPRRNALIMANGRQGCKLRPASY